MPQAMQTDTLLVQHITICPATIFIPSKTESLKNKTSIMQLSAIRKLKEKLVQWKNLAIVVIMHIKAGNMIKN